MLEAFRQWLESHQTFLSERGIDVRVSVATQVPHRSSMHAELRTPKYEWTIELWETGESEFHFLHWGLQDPDVVTTHYEFADETELYAALDAMLNEVS
jgi:hypothetical protein